MISYYSMEELDRVQVGESFPDEDGWCWEKVRDRLWLCQTSDGLFYRYAPALPRGAEPTETPLSDDQARHPAPTLGELVALRDSYWATDREARELGADQSADAVANLVRRIERVEDLIDERIGL